MEFNLRRREVIDMAKKATQKAPAKKEPAKKAPAKMPAEKDILSKTVVGNETVIVTKDGQKLRFPKKKAE